MFTFIEIISTIVDICLPRLRALPLKIAIKKKEEKDHAYI